MSPALWLVLTLAGTSLLLVGVLSAVFDWLPLASAVTLGIVGFAIETPAAIAFARSRCKPAGNARSQR